MQIVRTVFWILVLAILLVFTALNWKPVEVTLWENMIVETKVPALVIIAFLIGLIPTWLLHRGTKWRLNRRIGQLESAARTTAANRSAAAPVATATDTPDAPVVEKTVVVEETSAPVRPEPEHSEPSPVEPENPVDPIAPDPDGKDRDRA